MPWSGGGLPKQRGERTWPSRTARTGLTRGDAHDFASRQRHDKLGKLNRAVSVGGGVIAYAQAHAGTHHLRLLATEAQPAVLAPAPRIHIAQRWRPTENKSQKGGQ